MLHALARMAGVILGRPVFQPALQFVHRLALFGMNIGTSGDAIFTGERHALQTARSILSQTAGPYVLFDVGANIGDYTQECIEAFREMPTTAIYAFEPANAAFEQLRRVADTQPQVTAEQLALGDSEGQVTIYLNEPGSQLASLYDRRLEHHDIALELTETVDVTTIDSYCRTHEIPHIHFLKLDVEGHELATLAGAEQMIDSDAIDIIQFEFGGCNIDSRTFFRDFYYLLSPRYALLRILANGLAPLTAYTETQEAFLTSNFLAVHRNFRIT